MTADAPRTLLDALQASIASALRSPDGVADPVAVLWTDADGQWRPLIQTLSKVTPQLYVLGPYAPDERQGPVIWLKCIVDRTLPDVSPAPGVVPILYLPNVSRQELRAGGDCPTHLQPLIELQYRGTVWHQRNGRDWTVDAFLTSEDGVGLDIAKDSRTHDSILRALALLAPEPLAGLRGRRLEADDFDRLAIGDPVRDLLSWLSDAEGFQARCDAGRWATFRDICVREFKFDPDGDGTQAAADALLHGGGKWDEVWRRFCDSPRLYQGVSAVLRQARPRDLLGLVDQSRRPGFNEENEDKLRKAMEAALSLPHAQTCDKVAALDDEHKERRGWVWAQLGESPYAIALEPLGRLARAAKMALGGSTAETMAADYATQGWRCDRAAMEALSLLKQGGENGLVTKVVRALYEPWLDQSARRFQELMSAPGIETGKLTASVTAERDACVLFADGLRFDVGAVLQERLEVQGFRVRMSHRIAPIPTVTATAKPVASPAHALCSGKADAEDFAPVIASNNQPATASRLRDAMARSGVEILDQDQARMAVSSEAGGWTETGKLDELGHSLKALLVRQIDPEIDALFDRISGLLSAGWSRVRVVTDHGWLLLPGGLPKVELSPHLVATKWSRCAAVKGGSTPSIPTYPWYWNPVLRIASPPGIGAFVANTEYAHGGISLQECVIPELVVERGEEATTAEIIDIRWRGMRCRITAKSNAVGLQADLRLNWKQAASTIAAAPKELGKDGEASLAVSDDKHEGAAASVVILDASGRVLDYKPTTVGEDSMSIELDKLDKLAASVFDGYLVRKDLVRKYSRQYPVPTYVVEFLLGRYCASVNESEIVEGLQIVEKQLKDRAVRSGEEELFKARARETGSVKIIDIVRARLDAKNDCYIAELPSLNLRDVRIEDQLVRDNERMLTDGFYAEVTLTYDGIIAQEKGGRPFKVDGLRPIQMSKSDVLDVYAKARKSFTTAEWIDFLLRSIGLEASAFSERAKKVVLLRMVPFVERNYNLVELGPRGTGKSHIFQQISPYAHLISGGKATVAKMFVNNANGQRGLVCQYDVVCFDEVAGVSFDQKDGVNIMKGYMASGQFSRGKENIRAEGSIVMVGNLDVDVEQQQRVGHLLSPMPPEMRDDTAFMDRIHAYAPGWDYPKLKPGEHLTNQFGLVSDFLSECWSRLRAGNRVSVMQGRVHLGGALSGRDIEAVNKTVSGLTKLLFPDPEMPVSDEDLEWIVRVALESRRRVKEQQRRVFKSEFRNTHFSYTLGAEGAEQFVSTPELHSDEAIDSDPLPPGQVWGVSLGGAETGPGLFRIEVTCGPGGGVKILNQPTPPAFRESVRVGEQNLYTRSKELVGDRNPREEEFTIQMRPMDADKSGAGLGIPIVVGLCGGLLGRNTRGGTIIVGALNLGGSIEMIPNAVRIAELAIDKQAQTLLMPVSARRQLNDLPDELWTKISIEFYKDAPDAVFKALVE